MGIQRYLCALCIVLCLSGCGGEAQTDSLPSLEPYVEESKGDDMSPVVSDVVDSPENGQRFHYLKAVELRNEDVTVKTYAFDTAEYVDGKDTVISSMDGISILSCLVSGQPGLDSVIDGILDGIKKDPLNSKVQVPERTDAIVVDFDRTVDKVVYPSRCYIFTETVKDGIFLVSAITVDTSEASEQAVDVLKELSGIWDIN